MPLVACNNILTTHTGWFVTCYCCICLVYLHLNVMNKVTNSNKIEWTSQDRRCWRRLCWRQPNIIMGYQSIHPQQCIVIKHVVQGRDVFVSLPTSSWKSLCFCCLSLVFARVRPQFISHVVVAIIMSFDCRSYKGINNQQSGADTIFHMHWRVTSWPCDLISYYVTLINIKMTLHLFTKTWQQLPDILSPLIMSGQQD